MQPDDDDDLGAPAIEIGVELVSPRLDPTDLAGRAGYRGLGAVSRRHRAETVVEQTDLPKAVPTETDDPDRVVSPTDAKKPTDTPKMTTVEADPSEASVATEATAMPTVE